MPHLQGHRQRVSDHEAGHFVCLKTQIPERYKTFKICVLDGDSFADWDWEEIKGPPEDETPALVMREAYLGGICAEAVGMYLDGRGKRADGPNIDALTKDYSEISTTMRELAKRGGSGEADILKIVEGVNKGREKLGEPTIPDEYPSFDALEKPAFATAKRVVVWWSWLLKISNALLIHDTITELTYAERVGVMPMDAINAMLKK